MKSEIPYAVFCYSAVAGCLWVYSKEENRFIPTMQFMSVRRSTDITKWKKYKIDNDSSLIELGKDVSYFLKPRKHIDDVQHEVLKDKSDYEKFMFLTLL